MHVLSAPTRLVQAISAAALALVAAFLPPQVAEASTSARSLVRLAPADTWCPTGLTFGEGRPGEQPSAESVFDRGDFETSFRSPANGFVYLTLVATSELSIDNILVMPREQYFPPSSSFFDSSTCHSGSDPSFPSVRVRAFDASSLPFGTYLQRFDLTELGPLEDAGWQLGDAVLDLGDSAVERLPPGDGAAVTVNCPAGGATACPDGTGSLLLPAGTRVRLPVAVVAETDYLVQIWWKGPVDARIDVRVDDFAPCPDPPEGLFVEHESQIELEVLSADLMSGIDPEIFLLFALIEDQSDTFGTVTINGRSFAIPQIDGDDDPKWLGSARFAVSDLSDPSNVPIKIELFDNDEFDNAHVDLDSSPGDKNLDLTVDLCRMQVEGDLSVDMGGPIEARGDSSSGDDQGLLRFEISSPSGRPISTDDLAVVDVDFVQAVHGSRFAVTEKPGAVMVSVANNFDSTISTEVLVELFAPGFFVSQRFPVTLDGESRETFYFFNDTPIFPPAPTPGIETFLGINVHVDPDGVFAAGLPSGDCRLDNDTVQEKFWKLVDTSELDLTWCPVGRILEATDLVSDADLLDIRTLGTDFIRAIFPVSAVSSSTCPVPMPMTPVQPAIDFISAVLDSFEIPFSSVYPFALVWDMNTYAALTGTDKLLGVLPRAGWYEQFEGWANVSGNSLGEAAPHAAIFLPKVKDASDVEHPKVTLPAHELAHTFGVSADPGLKDTATCGVTLIGDPFGIGDLLCGATGGIDEYSYSDIARARGNPATGYWIETGLEDPRMAVFADQEQCHRHCFMGTSGADQLGNWASNGRWIDLGDWEHLIERLNRHPDPEVIYLGGMIDPADNAYIAPFFRMPAGIPDRIDGDAGGYRARFYGAQNELLQDIGFPATFGAAHSPSGDLPPITFFGFTVPWVQGTARIDIDRGAHDQTIPAVTIASRQVSANPPEIELIEPANGSELPAAGPLQVLWQMDDPDGDELQAVVMASLDGDTWSVVHSWTELESAALAREILPAVDSLQLKVFVTDGVHSAETEAVEIDASRTIFEDGFESGGAAAWSGVFP